MTGILTLTGLDHKGMAEVLLSKDVAKEVGGIAEKIGDEVQERVDSDVEVVVDHYTTDRAASSVTIKDVRALAWQARDGILSRPAASQGLEVVDR